MNTIEKFELNYVCDKCKEEITLDSSNILPGKLVGWGEDEFLTWYCKCPKCKSISELGNIEIAAIPREVKLELLDRYSGIADETMEIWLNVNAKGQLHLNRANSSYSILDKKLCKIKI